MKRLLLLITICISSVSFGQFNCADTTLVELTYFNSSSIVDITSPILFTDSGGENGNYSSNENYGINFNSGSSTNTLIVYIYYTDFEHGSSSYYDFMQVYYGSDGVNWTKYNGFTTNPSQNYDKVPDNIGNGVLPYTLDLGTQYIKFTFYSDASITKPGWKIILTPQNSSTSLGSETMTECNSYTWNTNGQTYTQTGQYTTVLTNAQGCDSTVTLDLTITQPNTGSETMTECNSYTWNTNGQTYTQSGQYTEVLTNQSGCDSTVTLNLTITNSNTGSETMTECNSYTWNTNGQTYTQTGQYTTVLTNAQGCDSTVTLDLTITQPNTGSETMTECNSYTWNTNGQTYTQTGQYTSVLTNQSGCDSTVTLNLTITNSNTGSESVTECDSYTWSTNGQTYTESGQYTEVLTNQSGCDSTVTLNLTIEIVDITTQPVDQTVVVGNNGQFTVTTSPTNPTYQWQMDDGTGFVNLSNAGQYSGTDTDVLTISNVQFGQNNFLYRCIVTSGNCEATSSVGRLTIQDNVGLDDINKNIFNVYPNPTSNSFTISSEKVINSEFTIIDSQGREMLTGIMNGQEHTIDISKLSKGVYSVVFNNTEYPVVSVIKE